MITLLLIRHELNDLVERAIAGWRPGAQVNESGRAQAEQLADKLAAAPRAKLSRQAATRRTGPSSAAHAPRWAAPAQ